MSEAGALGYRWRVNAGPWAGPDSREMTIYDDQAGRDVHNVSCEVNNWISAEQSDTIFNLLYRGMDFRECV